LIQDAARGAIQERSSSLRSRRYTCKRGATHGRRERSAWRVCVCARWAGGGHASVRRDEAAGGAALPGVSRPGDDSDGRAELVAGNAGHVIVRAVVGLGRGEARKVQGGVQGRGGRLLPGSGPGKAAADAESLPSHCGRA
jgi:hypothetical protein